MGLVKRAGPGIEERADRAAEAACELADAAAGHGWSAAAADDTLVAVDTLVDALAQISPEAGEALAAMAAATAAVRRRLGLPADAGAQTVPATRASGISRPHAAGRPWRRGLGPKFQGIG